MKRMLAALAVAWSIVLSGCASKPEIKYPMLLAPSVQEKALDCAALNDLIEKADAIRWSMRKDGVEAQSTVGRQTLAAASWILFLASAADGMAVPPKSFNDPVVALAAADQRIKKLLALKAEKSCPANSTSRPGVSDLDLLASLSTLDQSYKDRKVLAKDYFANHTQLLDSLRDPATLLPPSTPVPAESALP